MARKAPKLVLILAKRYLNAWRPVSRHTPMTWVSWFAETWRRGYVFLDMTLRRRDTECVLSMYRVHTRTTHASKEEDRAMVRDGAAARVLETEREVNETAKRDRLDPLVGARWRAVYDRFSAEQKEVLAECRKRARKTS